jgi:[ribosomal protein S5]-alanine N-acetyltransferase
VTSTRLLALGDADDLVELLRRNREFLAPWEPTRGPEFFTLDGQREAIRRMLSERKRGLTIPHVILAEDRVVGRVTLSNVVRGPLQSCTIGYWVSAGVNGQGHATAAVAQMAQVAFGELGLHRIEAGTLRHNTGSQRVLERNGFERIGVARSYLRIAGSWQDHLLYQLLDPDA